MDISIIIPTYKRSGDLKNVLDSIFLQTVLAKEIIIVDSANDTKTKSLITQLKMKEDTISIEYIYNSINSSAIARNVGAEIATADILLFLDDDVILQNNYIEEILKAYNKFDDALLVQGNIISEKEDNKKTNSMWKSFWQYYNKFFYLVHSTPNQMKVLMSGHTTSPSKPTIIINCQWASGCNLSIKKEIFKKYNFDDKLMKYSYGEDKDLSYRIYKNHPESIYLIPEAKLIHKGSFNKSSPVKKAIIMEKTYTLYFVAKNLGKPINYVFLIWSELGYFLANIIFMSVFLMIRRKNHISKFKHTVYSYYICIKYFKKIRNLDIEYINNKYIL